MKEKNYLFQKERNVHTNITMNTNLNSSFSPVSALTQNKSTGLADKPESCFLNRLTAATYCLFCATAEEKPDRVLII